MVFILKKFKKKFLKIGGKYIMKKVRMIQTRPQLTQFRVY